MFLSRTNRSCSLPGRTPSIHERLRALEWVRKQMMNRGSPDFLRQRYTEAATQKLIAKLLRKR